MKIVRCLIVFVQCTFDNGDMLSPKRHIFISLLFILKCFSKPFNKIGVLNDVSG